MTKTYHAVDAVDAKQLSYEMIMNQHEMRLMNAGLLMEYTQTNIDRMMGQAIRLYISHRAEDSRGKLPDPAIAFAPVNETQWGILEKKIIANDRKMFWRRMFNSLLRKVGLKWRCRITAVEQPEFYVPVITRRRSRELSTMEEISAEILFMQEALADKNWRPQAVIVHPSMEMILQRWAYERAMSDGYSQKVYGCNIVSCALLQPEEFKII
jgi:hypothetical protein